jgi:uncharacterized membrane protein
MRVEHEIRIDAPPEIVWAVTLDVGRWPEWTPTVTSVTRADDGPLVPGSVVRIRQPAQGVADWVVTEMVEGRRFAWQTVRPGLRMIAIHELDRDGTGTRNVLAVEAAGAAALLLWPLLRLAIRRALADENRGLRARCEAIAGQRRVDSV